MFPNRWHPRPLAEVLARWLPKKIDELGMLNVAETPPHVLPSLPPAVFDRAGLLERVMDDEHVAQEIIECFLDDAPRQTKALRRYLDAGDAAGVERQAHSIRGASANVGGASLCALAFEIEKAGKAGDLRSVAARMDELEGESIESRRQSPDRAPEARQDENTGKAPSRFYGECSELLFSCPGSRRVIGGAAVGHQYLNPRAFIPGSMAVPGRLHGEALKSWMPSWRRGHREVMVRIEQAIATPIPWGRLRKA